MNNNYNWIMDSKIFFPSFQDELQDKIHPFAQAQSLVYPFTGPIPNSLPQNILPLTQTPVVVPPFLQPEIMGVPKVKETIGRGFTSFSVCVLVQVWKLEIDFLEEIAEVSCHETIDPYW